MMLAIVHLLGMYVAALIKSRRRLEVENLVLVISSTSLSLPKIVSELDSRHEA
jgi:xanthosine utilization system XapX-like protein